MKKVHLEIENISQTGNCQVRSSAKNAAFSYCFSFISNINLVKRVNLAEKEKRMKNKITKISMCAMMALSCTPISAEGNASDSEVKDHVNKMVEVELKTEDAVNVDEVAQLPTESVTPDVDQITVETTDNIVNIGDEVVDDEIIETTDEATTDVTLSTDVIANSENGLVNDVNTSETLEAVANESMENKSTDLEDAALKQSEEMMTLELKAAPSVPEISDQILAPGQAIKKMVKFDVKLDADSKAKMEADGWEVKDYFDGTHNCIQVFDRNVTITYDSLKAEDGQAIPAFTVTVTGIEEAKIKTTINYIDSKGATVKSYELDYDNTVIPWDIVDGNKPTNYIIKDRRDEYDATVDETNDQLIATKQHLDVEVSAPEEVIYSDVTIEFNKQKTVAKANIVYNCRFNQDSIRAMIGKGYDVATTDTDGIFGTGTTTVSIGNIKEAQSIIIPGMTTIEGFNIPQVQADVTGFATTDITISGLGNSYVVSDQPVEFSVTTSQTNLDGAMVRVKLDRNGATQEDVKIEYLEPRDGIWYELTGDFFGPESGFPFINGTSKFRATFLKDTQGKQPYQFDLVVVDAAEPTVEYTKTVSTGQINVAKSEEDSASMTIELDKTGPYTVGDMVNMTITTHASGKYKGMMVKGAMTSNFDSTKVFAEYEENGVWKELKGDSFGGNGFPLIDGLQAKFRFTFKEAGDYETTINLVEAKENGEVVATNKLTAEVNPKDVEPEPTPDPKPTPTPDTDDSKSESKSDNKQVGGWDDGGPFTTNEEGDIFDRWGNLIYDAPAKQSSGVYQIVNTSDK